MGHRLWDKSHMIIVQSHREKWKKKSSVIKEGFFNMGLNISLCKIWKQYNIVVFSLYTSRKWISHFSFVLSSSTNIWTISNPNLFTLEEKWLLFSVSKQVNKHTKLSEFIFNTKNTKYLPLRYSKYIVMRMRQNPRVRVWVKWPTLCKAVQVYHTLKKPTVFSLWI